MLSAFMGVAIGMAIQHRLPWSTSILAALAITVPLWIGLPALQQARFESALLIPLIAAALLTPRLMGPCTSWGETPKILAMTAIALGLAGIAALARSLSFAELSLALASALLALILIGPKTDPGRSGHRRCPDPARMSRRPHALQRRQSPRSSRPEHRHRRGAFRARRSPGQDTAHVSTGRVLLYCLLPTVAAILIARIDGGSISIY